jgi:ATPase subunit of ABC transporter with duplicated ATPase domains
MVLAIENMKKAFGRHVIYDGLNINVRRGERWCVMGRNGAGKSTLLKMVAGALIPDAGEVRIGAAVKIGYFAQQALDLLDPDLTIEEQLQRDFPRTALVFASGGRLPFSGDEIDKRSARSPAARRPAW